MTITSSRVTLMARTGQQLYAGSLTALSATQEERTAPFAAEAGDGEGEQP